MRQRWLNVVVGSLLALGTGELAMRRYCFAPRVFDAQLGFVGDPARTSRWVREGDGEAHFETHGIRANGAAHVGDPLLVLGDSMTEALQVNDAQTYAAVLARALAPRFSTLNAGYSGASLGRYIALAPAFHDLFHARWTIVQFDIHDFQDAWVPSDSHFVRDDAGRLTVVQVSTAGQGGTIRKLIRRLRAKSALLQNAVLQIAGLQAEWAAWRPFRNGTPPAPSRAEAPRPPIEEELEQLVDAFEGRVTLLLLPHEGTYGDHPTQEQVAFRQVCARHHWSCPRVEEAFAKEATSGRTPLGFPNSGYDQGHLNAVGHAAVADVLAKEIARLAQNGLL